MTAFWPDGARLAISFSLMFEAGGQPILGAGGVIPERIEGGVKLSSFMIGKAVETSPDLAREIVRRGHEAAAHGRTWENSYQLPPDEEKRFIADCVETIERVTGQRPVGWNAYWMRSSVHTSRAGTSPSSFPCAGATS